jgi:recombination protein RecA
MPPRKSSKEKETTLQEGLPLDEGRQKALESTLTDLTKRFGDGTVMRLGDAQHLVVEVIPTGSLTTDIAVGVGGIPRGRVTEIYGPESSGKTTICLHVIAEAQKRGGLCAFVDMEHALDPSYAAKIGVNIDNLYVAQPDTAEQALEITEAFVRSGAMDVIVLDSVAALVPRVEIEGEMGESHVGVQARLMSQALRKLAGAIKSSNVAVLFTNQLREKIGVMYGCFTGDAKVLLADGTEQTIETLVREKRDVEVMSLNTETGMFEPRRILNHFDNGLTDEFLRVQVRTERGIAEFTCTPNHRLLTPQGYEEAGELDESDLLLTVATDLQPVVMMEMAGETAYNVTVNPQLDSHKIPFKPEPMAILSIEEVWESCNRFDLEIEGNHSYVVDGVVVHNSPETTSGGRALKFYASIRLDVRKLESIKASGGEVIGSRTRVRVTKNKVAPPFREAEFDIAFGEGGISKLGEIIDLATELGIIEKRGAFFRYNDGLLGQGRENAKQYLGENPAVRDELEDAVRAHYNLPLLRG